MNRTDLSFSPPMYEWLLISLLVAIALLGAASRVSGTDLDFDTAEAVAWVQENGDDPIEYVAGKFDQFDIVILGEEHRVREFPKFVADCIPRIYDRGVTVLAMEFENSINQPLVDSFLALPWLDNSLLYAIRRNTKGDSFILFKEYNDIFRKCWSFNQSLPPDAPRLRIVALDLADDDPADSTQGSERGYVRDAHMARVLTREAIMQQRKVLVYCGWMHAMTRLVPPKVTDGHVLTTEHRVRLGNHLWECCKDQTFSIFFYAPYLYTPDSLMTRSDVIIPVDGLVEKVMSYNMNRRVGFDMAGSPFAGLSSTGTFFRFMKMDWTLADLCDGYVFLQAVADWEAVGIEDVFLDDSTFQSFQGESGKHTSRLEYLEYYLQDAVKTVTNLKGRAYKNLESSSEQ